MNLVVRLRRRAAQETVYRFDGTRYVRLESPSTLNFPGQPWSVSFYMLLTDPSGNRSVASQGFSWTHSERNFSLELVHNTRQLKMWIQGDGELHSLTSTISLPDTASPAWALVEFGWNSAAQAWIRIDGVDAGTLDVPVYNPISRTDDLTIGGHATNLESGFEIYGFTMALNAGQFIIAYPFDDDTDGICQNSETTTGGADGALYNAEVRNSSDLPEAGILAIPSAPLPEEPEPGPDDNILTAYCPAEPEATFTWQCLRDADASGQWNDAINNLTDATLEGTYNQIIRFGAATSKADEGLVRPLAHTPTYVDGVPPPDGEEARLIVVGDDTGTPIESDAFRLAVIDLTAAMNQGFDATGSKGAAVTVWGWNLGTTQDASNFIRIKHNSGSTVDLTAATNYPAAEPWGEYGKPIPWLQRITFWLNDTVPVGASTVHVVINGEEGNGLPLNVYDDGRIFHIDIAAGDDGNDGSHDSPWATPAPWLKSLSESNTNLAKPGDLMYYRGGTTADTLMWSGGEGQAMLRHDYARPPGTEARPIAHIGYPDGVAITIDGVTNNGVDGPMIRGVLIETHWITVSKLTVSGTQQGIITKGRRAEGIGGWGRIVGCDVEGCKTNPGSGTGIITLGPGNSPANGQGSGDKVLACTAHGGTTCNRYDHAFYPAGAPIYDEMEVAFCYSYNNNFGRGSHLSDNHQPPRVPDGTSLAVRRFHHNFIDCRNNQAFWPPSVEDCTEFKGVEDDNFQNQPMGRAIGIANDGHDDSGGVNVLPGARAQVYHNILLGTAGAPNQPTGHGLCQANSSGGSDWYHNAFIDWGVVCWNWTDAKVSPTINSYNNLYLRNGPDLGETEGKIYSDSTNATMKSEKNIYYDSSRTIDAGEVQDSRYINMDPYFSYVIDQGLPFQFGVTQDSGMLNSALQPQPNQVFDFNGFLYRTSTIDIGPTEYQPEETPAGGE